MRKRFLVRRYAILLACVMLAVFAAIPAAASGGGYGECGLRISYMDGKAPIPGVTFRAYRAAGYLGQGVYSMEGGFAGCGAVLDGAMTNRKWEAAAQAMLSCVEKNGIKPDASGKTGENGTMELSGLMPGVYLVEGDRSAGSGMSYTPQAFCVMLPGRDSDGLPVYTVTAEPKHETQTEATEATEAPQAATEAPATPKTGDTAGQAERLALMLACLSILSAFAASRAMGLQPKDGGKGGHTGR